MNHFAKKLRKNSTQTENKLWFFLRAKRFEGLKFRRQHPLGPYIVDFVCLEKYLVIECDGGQHLDQAKKDFKRDEWLQKEGFKVLRFWDDEVLKNIETVLEIILKTIRDHPPPHPLPSREGG